MYMWHKVSQHFLTSHVKLSNSCTNFEINILQPKPFYYIFWYFLFSKSNINSKNKNNNNKKHPIWQKIGCIPDHTFKILFLVLLLRATQHFFFYNHVISILFFSCLKATSAWNNGDQLDVLVPPHPSPFCHQHSSHYHAPCLSNYHRLAESWKCHDWQCYRESKYSIQGILLGACSK